MEQSRTLDAIRGAAALFVVVAHAAQIWLWPLTGPHTVFYVIPGEMAVWSVATFFALSGLVIATSARRRISGGRFDLSSFIEARLLRIFPPLFAAVVVTIASVWLIKTLGLYGSETYRLATDHMTAREVADYGWSSILPTISLSFGLGFGSYMSFNGPLWSLGYEFWLYVFMALLLAGVINRNILALLLALGGAAWIVRSDTMWLAFAPVWLAGFAIGWLAPRHGRRAIGMILVVCVTLACAVLIYEGGIFDPYQTTVGRLFYVLTGLAIAACLGLVPPDLKGWSVRLFAASSDSSYTLYVTHFPLVMLGYSFLRPLVMGYGLAGHLAGATSSILFAVTAASLIAPHVENFSRRRRAAAAQEPSAGGDLRPSGGSSRSACEIGLKAKPKG